MLTYPDLAQQPLNALPQAELSIDDRPWIDLRTYDQSHFDRGRPGWLILLWWLVQAVTFPLTPHFASGLRCWILRQFGAEIGEGVLIRPTARFTYPWKIRIDAWSWIGDDVVLYSLDHIHIGEHCVVSQKSYICTGSHDVQDPSFGLTTAPVTIGNGAWIATDCFIAPGVTIGTNSIIGARSTVLRDLPAGQVCWGSPCKAKYERTMLQPKLTPPATHQTNEPNR
ncbi:colanic acid biosynthesis acetyltransferase WcaF [filamentous cyanobacterium LEGE 11480]|uniref:Colanic acid biosynthesis acetyltransferase WcaF n=1 Tax=Romeriopsis navalis LEGE 11480 TaxID=2777977 RepID=A0A928VKK9_9CYAN|nr:hormogonium polysaccharide biosynthesis acetyltransferase HpsU [Romeriopsis navalis]MBE9029453.1 colanic acid biosynthesis acetyltransferase WcaF [Romeriopsis navalis LEGE 11480]